MSSAVSRLIFCRESKTPTPVADIMQKYSMKAQMIYGPVGRLVTFDGDFFERKKLRVGEAVTDAGTRYADADEHTSMAFCVVTSPRNVRLD